MLMNGYCEIITFVFASADRERKFITQSSTQRTKTKKKAVNVLGEIKLRNFFENYNEE